MNNNSVTGDLWAFGNTFRSEMKNFSGHEVISAFELFVCFTLYFSYGTPSLKKNETIELCPMAFLHDIEMSETFLLHRPPPFVCFVINGKLSICGSSPNVMKHTHESVSQFE